MIENFNAQASIILLTLGLTFVLFVWSRWRYDLVSLGTLLFLTVVGVVPAKEAFSGFSHPAVVTVVAVLVVSRGLQNSGILDHLSSFLASNGMGKVAELLILCVVTAALSAFINNIGALAVILPVALRSASEKEISPSLYLMPIAFSSLLGGLTTLIGTPPNIIIASFRAQTLGTEYGLFDFSYVGLPVAILGILLLLVLCWRVLPERRKPHSGEKAFDVGAYTTELLVPEDSKVVGQTFGDLQELVSNELLLLVHAGKSGRRRSLARSTILAAEDILVIEGPPAAIESLLDKTDLSIVSNDELEETTKAKETLLFQEAVVAPDSSLAGRMPRARTLRQRYGVALLAVARQGRRLRRRFSQMRLRMGDVLLLRGEPEDMEEMLKDTRCLPLAARDIQVGLSPSALLAVLIFLFAMATILFRLLPAQIALPLAAVLMVLNGIVPLRTVYQQIDWSIVVLLGALLPVGHALETSGAAQLIVESLISFSHGLGPEWVLGILFVTVMFLSDIVNNAAAAALSAPIALQVAQSLGVAPDAFLMAVAIAASCAFLTPIGHQSNTLVMGPGGYRFTDYWRLGLPLEILIVLISIPSRLYFWPLS